MKTKAPSQRSYLLTAPNDQQYEIENSSYLVKNNEGILKSALECSLLPLFESDRDQFFRARLF